MAKKFEVPKELSDKVLQVIQEAKSGGKLRKGTNETTKSIEKSEAQLVVIANDINPPEIVAHIPLLCEEKKIPVIWVPTKRELGAAAGLPVGTSSVAVADAGEAKKKLVEIAKSIAVLIGAEKPAPKAEAPKPAEHKAEAKPMATKPAEKPKEKKPKAPKAEAPKPAEPAEQKQEAK